MKFTVMLGEKVNMSNVSSVCSKLMEGQRDTYVRLQRTVPRKNFLVEFDAKTQEAKDEIYDRAHELFTE